MLLVHVAATSAADGLPVVVAYRSGELPQRRAGLGYVALRDLPPPAQAPSLSALDAHRVLEPIAGMAGRARPDLGLHPPLVADYLGPVNSAFTGRMYMDRSQADIGAANVRASATSRPRARPV